MKGTSLYMRIIIGTSGLPPGAGIGSYVDEIARWLISHGHEILVCCASFIRIDETRYSYPVFFTQVMESVRDEYAAIQELYNKIMKFEPDAIINNNNIYISGILPCLDPKCVRLSVVHGYRNHFGWDQHKIINAAAVYNYSYIDWVVATSNCMRLGMISNLHIKNNQIKLIYNGIQPLQNDFVSYRTREKDSEIKIFFGGGKKIEKGADVLLSAIKKLDIINSVRIKIYWIDGLPYRALLYKKDLEKQNIIKDLGIIKRIDLLQLLGQCHFIIMPSLVEGCPMLLLEAMSLGVVPIVSDCCSAMREIAAKGDCGIVVPTKNATMLANAIKAIASPIFPWREKAKCARDFFFANLHIDICGNRLLQLCKMHRKDRIVAKVKFPPQELPRFHRKPYFGSKISLKNLIHRWKYIYGILDKMKTRNIDIFY